MLINQINKMSFHLIYSLKKVNIIIILRYFLLFFSYLYFLNFVIHFKINKLRCFIFSFIFSIQNNDLYLLKREISIFILLWIKILFTIKNIILFYNIKKYSVIRSPFVYSKSHEQYEIRTFKIFLHFKVISNILFYLYFLNLKVFIYRYGLFKIVKHLI